MLKKLGVSKKYFGESCHVDEVHQIRFGNGSVKCAKSHAYLELFKIKTVSAHFDVVTHELPRKS